MQAARRSGVPWAKAEDDASSMAMPAAWRANLGRSVLPQQPSGCTVGDPDRRGTVRRLTYAGRTHTAFRTASSRQRRGCALLMADLGKILPDATLNGGWRPQQGAPHGRDRRARRLDRRSGPRASPVGLYAAR